MGLGEVERLLAFDHFAGDAALVAVLLHQRLAGGDRIALGDDGGHAERDDRDGKHNAFHHVFPSSWIGAPRMDREHGPRGNGGRVVWNTYRSLLFQTVIDTLPRLIHDFVNDGPRPVFGKSL